MKREELAARVLTTFLDELDEQLPLLNAELLALEADASNATRLRTVFRVMHTLKGAARAAGVPRIEMACHGLESMLAAVRGGTATLGSHEFALLFEAADALGDAGDRLRRGEQLEGTPIAALATATIAAEALLSQSARGRAAGTESGGPRPRVAEAAPAPVALEVAADPAEGPADVAVSETPAAPDHPERHLGTLRVESEKLDSLFASVGSLAVVGAHVIEHAAELDALELSVHRALTEWRRAMRGLRRKIESDNRAGLFDALDGAQRGFERIGRRITRMAAASAHGGRSLDTATRRVAEQVRSLRMRPFTDACQALPRAVRDVAAATGKQAQLRVVGGDVEADRAVLDGIREALLQLVRNAVDHGIEVPELRAARGKAIEGTVTVAARLRGDRLLVTVSDDGSGVDTARVREAVARSGRVAPADLRALAGNLIAGGLTTRDEASEFSGRGVGLDVARSAVAALGGVLDVEWVDGDGTSFTMDLPATLARVRALMVTLGPQLFAIPTMHVQHLLRLRLGEIKRVEGRDVFMVPHEDTHMVVPIVPLAAILGAPFVAKPLPDPASVVLLSVGGQRVGIVVDGLRGEQELVGQRLPGKRTIGRHCAGAAMLPNGGVALVLDVHSIVDARHGVRGVASTAGGTGQSSRPPTVLVVDDSLTTRTLERGVLEAAGYRVLTAIDGADGWRVLEEEGCDLVLSDIEMPRMDGFALCEAIRSSERHGGVPVVLVTALESAEDRARGLALGANAYIGKSSFDQQNLLETVEQLIGPVDE